jgi:hypothetical protein
MSNSPQNHNLPEELKAALESDDSEKNYNMKKAIVNTLPAGALFGGFFESYIVSPATKRRDKFLEILVRELMELKSKIELVDYESPAFQTFVIRAYQIAARTHKEQKLEALRNIVLNSSIPRTLEDDIVEMFLGWVDNFTELHISTLKHLHYLDRYAPGQLDRNFPMIEGNRSIYNKVLKDLADQGLISLKENYITVEDNDDKAPSFERIMSEYHLDMWISPKKEGEKEIKMKTFKFPEDIDTILKKNASYRQESKTTELGKQFIKFIEYPSILTESL